MATMTRGYPKELLGGFSLTKALRQTANVVTAPARMTANAATKVLEVAKVIKPPKGTVPQATTQPEPAGFSMAGKGKWVVGGVALLAVAGLAMSMRRGGA